VSTGFTPVETLCPLPAVLPEVAPDRTGSGQSVSTGVNPVLTLGDDLRASEERTVLEYSTA
jgi:hypothetical protein